MSLKSKIIRTIEIDYLYKKDVAYLCPLYCDIQDSINDWILFVKACNLAGQFKSKEAKNIFNKLCKRYKCKRYELGFNKIIGNWEK